MAGRQQGITNGKRSSLFFTVTQLIRDTPKESRPSYLLIENVKNLLSINAGVDFLKLQIELDEIGYDVEWDVLDSAEVVPQHRERLFIIGHLRGRSTRKIFPICQNCEEASEANGPSTNTLTTRYSEAQGNGSYVVEGESKKVHQIGNISSSKSFGGNPQIGRVYGSDGLSPTLSTMQGGGREPKIIQRARGNNHGGVKSIAPTLSTHSYQDNNLCVDGYSIRKLTPRECWRLQGFPDWAFNRAKQAGLSDSQLYKQAGNSVTVPVIKAIAEKMEAER